MEKGKYQISSLIQICRFCSPVPMFDYSKLCGERFALWKQCLEQWDNTRASAHALSSTWYWYNCSPLLDWNRPGGKWACESWSHHHRLQELGSSNNALTAPWLGEGEHPQFRWIFPYQTNEERLRNKIEPIILFCFALNLKPSKCETFCRKPQGFQFFVSFFRRKDRGWLASREKG